MIFVLMGVTGCGKTTIGVLLSEASGIPFVDADDHHPHENVEKMRRGEPLTDEDRAPWLAALAQMIAKSAQENKSLILACSALRSRYRDVLSAGTKDVTFVHLRGAKQLIAERLAERKHRYMNPTLLQSQFDTLEATPELVQIEVTGTPADVVQRIKEKLAL